MVHHFWFFHLTGNKVIISNCCAQIYKSYMIGHFRWSPDWEIWCKFRAQTYWSNIQTYFAFCQGFRQGFFHTHWRLTGQQGKGKDHLLLHSTTSAWSQIFRHSLAALHVRWLSRILNRIDCIYQTVTQWNLPPKWITISLINDVMFLFDYLIIYLLIELRFDWLMMYCFCLITW